MSEQNLEVALLTSSLNTPDVFICFWLPFFFFLVLIPFSHGELGCNVIPHIGIKTCVIVEFFRIFAGESVTEPASKLFHNSYTAYMRVLLSFTLSKEG